MGQPFLLECEQFIWRRDESVQHLKQSGSFLQKKAKSHGFTIIELAIALFLVMLVFAAAIPFASKTLSEEQLREPARRFKLFAKTARGSAMTQRKTFEIGMDKDHFSIRVMPETRKGNRDWKREPSVVKSYSLPDGVRYVYKAWGDKEWFKPDEAVWIFRPTGICEPLMVRFMKEEAWIELEFNPLTANVQIESFYFP